jgi:hypothetical protein
VDVIQHTYHALSFVAVVENLTAEMNTLVALMIVAVALFLIMNTVL